MAYLFICCLAAVPFGELGSFIICFAFCQFSSQFVIILVVSEWPLAGGYNKEYAWLAYVGLEAHFYFTITC